MTRRGVVSRLVDGSGAYFGTVFFSTIVSLFTLPILLKNLNVEEYSTFALISIYLGFFAMIFDGGVKSAVTIEFNNYEYESEEFKKFLGVISSITFVLSTLFCVLVIIIDLVFKPYGGFIIFQEYQALSILKISAILCLIGVFTNLMAVLYRMREKPRVILYHTIITSSLALISTYYFVEFLDMGVDGAVRALIITTSLGGLLSVFLILSKSKFSWNLTETKRILTYTLPLVLLAITNWSQKFSDRILIELMLSKSEMSIYHLGSQMANYMIILGMVIHNAWTPIFFETMKNNIRGAEAVSKFTSFSVALGAFGVILFVEIGDEILRIISTEEYSYSTTVMSMIACSVIPALLCAFNGLRLIRNKKTTTIAAISGAGAILNVLLNLILLPKVGLIGAGLSSIFTYSITAVLIIFFASLFDEIVLVNRDLMIGTFVVFFAMAIREMNIFDELDGMIVSFTLCVVMGIWAIKCFSAFRSLVD